MDVCTEKHKQIDKQFEVDKDRLNNHGERIDKLEQFKSSTEIEIKNLVEQIRALVSTIKWFMVFGFTTFFSFFIWYVQTLGR